MDSAEPTLYQRLEKQLENYRAALELEQQLAAILASGDLSSLKANTAEKKKILQAIKDSHAALEPKLRQQRGDDGTIVDAACEKLRGEALALLQQIAKVEAENLETMRKGRAESLAGLELARKAKQVARGYKPSKEARNVHHRLDTKT